MSQTFEYSSDYAVRTRARLTGDLALDQLEFLAI
jgi:hypothetical protein